MTTISQYSLGQIRDIIPPKLKQQWDRIPANTALIGGVAIAAGIGCYLGYRWATAIRLQAITPLASTAITTISTTNAECSGLDPETVEAVKQVAENTPVAIGEGQVVHISGREFLVVREENSLLDIYMLDKKRPVGLGSNSTVRQLFSLIGHSWGKAIKVPRYGNDTADIANGVKMVGFVNSDGKTRGCIRPPYLVRTNTSDSDSQSVIRGSLMSVYDSDATKASKANGIIDLLRHHSDPEPYFVDMVHQALSILAKLQRVGIVHNDIKTDNIFVSRSEDGFIEFHLGDWDSAYVEQCELGLGHSTDIIKMTMALLQMMTGMEELHINEFKKLSTYEILSYLPPEFSLLLRDIIRKMHREQCDIGHLLKQLNQTLASKARPDASTLWQNVARRAGIKYTGSFWL